MLILAIARGVKSQLMKSFIEAIKRTGPRYSHSIKFVYFSSGNKSTMCRIP